MNMRCFASTAFPGVHSQWDLLRKYGFVESRGNVFVSTLQMLPTVALKWSGEVRSKAGHVASLKLILISVLSEVWMSWGNLFRTTESQCLSASSVFRKTHPSLRFFWTPVFVLVCFPLCDLCVMYVCFSVSKACICGCSSFRAKSYGICDVAT